MKLQIHFENAFSFSNNFVNHFEIHLKNMKSISLNSIFNIESTHQSLQIENKEILTLQEKLNLIMKFSNKLLSLLVNNRIVTKDIFLLNFQLWFRNSEGHIATNEKFALNITTNYRHNRNGLLRQKFPSLKPPSDRTLSCHLWVKK